MSYDDAQIILEEIKKLQEQLATMQRKIEEIDRATKNIETRVSALRRQ
jgi:prefoldin subunit 5